MFPWQREWRGGEIEGTGIAQLSCVYSSLLERESRKVGRTGVWGGGGRPGNLARVRGLGCSGLVSVGAPPGVAEAPVSLGWGGGGGSPVH